MSQRAVIPQVKGQPQWEKLPALEIGCYPWGGDYRPRAQAKICYVTGQGFAVQLCCWEPEAQRRAVVTENDQLVCVDSCLECFLNFAPQNPEIGYLNLEVNPRGTQWCQYGIDRHCRTFLREQGLPYPEVTPFSDSSCWGYTAFIPLSTVREIYKKDAFQPGDLLRGNFYKCGDLTAQPHYGCWSHIQWPEPDFHRPEFFGELVLGPEPD